MRTVFDRRVRKLGLTRAQWLVLTRLHRRPGASQSELADMMEVEKATAGRLIRVVHRPGSVQTEIRIGHRGLPRHIPDFHAVSVMSAILGGLLASLRLCVS